MRRKFLGAICLANAGIFLSLSAGYASASGPAEPSGLYIAEGEHLFEAEGLNVTIDSIISSADATTGQNDGTYDITAGNFVSHIQDQVNIGTLHVIDVAWLPEPFGSADAMQYGFTELADLDQGATTNFPVGRYVVTKAWARKYPHTLAAFLDAFRQGQQIADTDRAAVEQAMQELPRSYTVPPFITAVVSLENYPLNVAPDIDASRVQRVADAMFQFRMLTQPFRVSSKLG